MHVPRTGGSLTPWGTTLVVTAGGVTHDSSVPYSPPDNFPTSVEAYDLQTGEWVDLPALPSGTDYPYAVTLHDGSLLVLTTGHAYRLATLARAWSDTPAPAIDFGASLTLLADGDVLVAGGENATNGSTAAAYVLHVATMSWTAVAPMHLARAQHSATLLKDGRVLVAGGYTNNDVHITDSAEIFDPARGRWTVAASMPDPRSNHAATLLPAGDVLVVGGMEDASRGSTDHQRPVWVYDPVADRWSSTEDLTSGLDPAPGGVQPRVLPLHGNQVLALGNDEQGRENTPQLGRLGAHC
jgi:hypothetical protein